MPTERGRTPLELWPQALDCPQLAPRKRVVMTVCLSGRGRIEPQRMKLLGPQCNAIGTHPRSRRDPIQRRNPRRSISAGSSGIRLGRWVQHADRLAMGRGDAGKPAGTRRHAPGVGRVLLRRISSITVWTCPTRGVRLLVSARRRCESKVGERS